MTDYKTSTDACWFLNAVQTWPVVPCFAHQCFFLPHFPSAYYGLSGEQASHVSTFLLECSHSPPSSADGEAWHASLRVCVTELIGSGFGRLRIRAPGHLPTHFWVLVRTWPISVGAHNQCSVWNVLLTLRWAGYTRGSKVHYRSGL